MNWTRPIDAYCERLSPAYWAEPVNALTNAAFILAAVIMWRRTAGLPLARGLSAILAIIGVGSFLFHTQATAWAAMADSSPIGVFILIYLYAVNRHVWNWPVWGSILGVAAFIPYNIILTQIFDKLPFLTVSAFYWPVPLLILLTAALLRSAHPATARGLALGALILTVSLTFRSLDLALCAIWPVGTHFLWHLLNAVMLGWMIEVYRRHRSAGGVLAGPGAGR